MSEVVELMLPWFGAYVETCTMARTASPEAAARALNYLNAVPWPVSGQGYGAMRLRALRHLSSILAHGVYAGTIHG